MSNHIEMIEKELEHAKKKHPFFANSVMINCGHPYAFRRLKEVRSQLNCYIHNDEVNGLMILDCELAEAQEAYSRKDYSHCTQELAQCAAVIIRIMEAVEEEAQKGDAK